jgi:colanic acid/amylovoran biosynthesis glycosyltransferase
MAAGSQGAHKHEAELNPIKGGEPVAGAKIVYVTTRFPSISHTFILREVQALRAAGVAVHTVSIRRADGEHLLSEDNRRALSSTYSIRPPRWREVLRAHGCAFVRHPRAYLSTLGFSMRIVARPGLRGAAWRLFYFAEAIMLWHESRRVGALHMHAHHGSPPADLSLLAARFGAAAGSGPRTWSMTMHGPTEFSDTRWFGLAEKLRRANGVVCISDFARSQVMALIDQEQWAKLSVIHCGLLAEQYERLRAAPGSTRQILCVGRLVSEKGQAVLVEAHASLRRRGHEVDLVLVGSGPCRSSLERLAAQLGVAAHVRFSGPLGEEEVRQLYADAAVFCSSSFAEGVPVVLMEAMASGCPVVATAIAGVGELVQHRETGLLVSPGRADELAAAIAELLENDELSKNLSEAGRRYVADEFDVRDSAVALQAFFESLLAGEGPGASVLNPTESGGSELGEDPQTASPRLAALS